MGALIRFSLLACFFLLTKPAVFSQESLAEKIIINEYTLQANQLIYHINVNINELYAFQEELAHWYENNLPYSELPNFTFQQLYNEQEVSFFLQQKRDITVKSPLFDYTQTFATWVQEVNFFNSLCKNIQNTPRTADKEAYYNALMIYFVQLNVMSPQMVELCYDFSRSCRLNFGNQHLPFEFKRLQDMVSNAKNIIMYIRYDNPDAIISQLAQMDEAIAEIQQHRHFADLKRVAKLKLNQEQILAYQNQMVEMAMQIAYYAEQYLQSNRTPEEALFITQNALQYFNFNDNNSGASGIYNDLLSQAENTYLLFTEEPLAFELINKPDQVVKAQNNQLITVVQDTIVVKQNESIANNSLVKDTIAKIEQFDVNDLNSLSGALPNNLIVLMDVSASMKKSGKLPLLKSSLLHLIQIMRPEDKISLIAYSGEAEVLIENAGVEDRSALYTTLDTLHSSGGTDIVKAVNMAYDKAFEYYLAEGNNRIILATDGEFGVTNSLLKVISENANSNVFLSVFQYNLAQENVDNEWMMQIAGKGSGSYFKIVNSNQALSAMMKEVKHKR